MSYKITSCVLLCCIGSLYAMEKCKDPRDVVSSIKNGSPHMLPEDKPKKSPTTAQEHVVTKKKDTSSLMGTQSAISGSQKKDALQAEAHTLKVLVNITPHNMSYPVRFFGRIPPTKFSMVVNGQPVHLNDKFIGSDELAIPLTDNKLEVAYTYAFKDGIHYGTDRYLFEIPPDMKEATLEFAWETPPVHVRIPGAKFIKKV